MGSTPNPTVPLPFIGFIGHLQSDPKTRRLIRSQVMMGKNRGKVLPGQKRRPKKQSLPAPSEARTPERASNPPRQRDPSSPPTWLPATAQIPRDLGQNLALVQTADKLEPATINLLFQFCTLTKRALFSLGGSLQCDQNLVDGSIWVLPLASDAAYSHTLVFASQIYYGWAGGCRGFDYTLSLHYQRVLRLLQLRLSHGSLESKTSYTTMAVVLALAVIAHLNGDVAVARDHMLGICEVVRLRGGIVSLRNNPKLLVILMRCDLAMALHNSVQPVFLEDIVAASSSDWGVDYYQFDVPSEDTHLPYPYYSIPWSRPDTVFWL
ncbi:hypothetical protein PG990_010578 [Apiospora arundinis]